MLLYKYAPLATSSDKTSTYEVAVPLNYNSIGD
jgi:hypothetical protein